MKLTSEKLKHMIAEEINEGFLDKFFGAFGAKDKPQDDTVVMGLDFRWDRPELAKQAKALGYTDEEIEIIAFCYANMPLPPRLADITTEKLGGLIGTNFSKKFENGTSEKVPVPKNFRIFYERRYVDLLKALAAKMSGNRWFRDLFNFLTDRGNGEFRGNYKEAEHGALKKILRAADDTYNRFLRSVGVPPKHLPKDTTRTPNLKNYFGG